MSKNYEWYVAGAGFNAYGIDIDVVVGAKTKKDLVAVARLLGRTDLNRKQVNKVTIRKAAK